jgi:hypothetical protein
VKMMQKSARQVQVVGDEADESIFAAVVSPK